ncbi:MAG: sodium:calcium antiporter [Rhizobiales bacterium]|nr:sodium:calcium antiporter [Hyphomicrobiales bacterium]MBA70094.1 sodium:calcium antiporter [Hyphomicrobiales bacterium]
MATLLSTLPGLLGGLIVLSIGAEALVSGAVTIARRFSMPPLLIGVTIVGFGTSLPELVVSLKAALRDAPDIAVGNVVGSNIANILLIVGLAAIIAPIAAKFLSYRRDLLAMLAASLLMLALGWSGDIGRIAGGLMLAGLVVYLVYTARCGMAEETDVEPEHLPAWRRSLPVAGVSVVIGLGALFLGANWLVDGAIEISRAFGLSEAAIGLTVVAVGTSLPELATSVAAAIRRHGDVALGNVIGSNTFNILGILGITSIISPVEVSPAIASTDIPVMLATALALTALIAFSRGIGRVSGIGLLVLYSCYVVWLLAG